MDNCLNVRQNVSRSWGVGELESEDQDGSKGYEKFSSQETREGFCASQDGCVPSDSKIVQDAR